MIFQFNFDPIKAGISSEIVYQRFEVPFRGQYKVKILCVETINTGGNPVNVYILLSNTINFNNTKYTALRNVSGIIGDVNVKGFVFPLRAVSDSWNLSNSVGALSFCYEKSSPTFNALIDGYLDFAIVNSGYTNAVNALSYPPANLASTGGSGSGSGFLITVDIE